MNDIKSKNKIEALQKTKYLEIVQCLWECGPEETNQEYPDISVEEFITANDYYDSLRCAGCHCGSCVNLGKLSSNLDKSPPELKPIADLAIKLGQEAFNK